MVFALGFACPALAWKPLTHADQARKAIAALPADHALRPILEEHREYLYAGSVGPDLYYALFPERDTLLSDIAHYCRTDKLAARILGEARGNPRLAAFAHGWISHNVADSAAHPWVNGFVGASFHGSIWRALIPLTDNNVHGVIEAWVNAQFTAGTDRAEFTRAMRLFATDAELQKLLGAAFEATYGDLYHGRVCQNGEWEDREGFKFPRITRINVEHATHDAGVTMASKWTWGAFADGGDFPLWLIPHLPVIGDTAPDYLGLTRAYVALSWGESRAPPGFNLDIGINDAHEALEDAYTPPSDPTLRRNRVFPTPGARYVVGGGQPDFIDRCKEVEPKVCMTGPGGDWPDDNLSAGVPHAPATSELPTALNREAMFWRLALKKGAAWPIDAAHLHRLEPVVNAVADAGDREALASAHAQVAETLRRGAEASPVFADLYARHGRPNATEFYATSDVLLLRKGYMGQVTSAIEQSAEPTLWTQPESLQGTLAADHPILVVPSGGLHGLSDAATFKAQLASYVAAGGTAIVFSQQRGSDYAVLPTPDGRPIGAWGWSEDNSCYYDAAYVETFHPLLASQSRALVTSAIDGFFDGVPEGSTVLLRRVKNGLPAMFMYAYGAGRVIVTSSYDDWGGFNQSSAGARAIIRDAISWAKRPEDLLLHTPGASAEVTLQVRNHGPVGAAQVKLTLLSPSRDRVIDEIVVPLVVPANGSAAVDYAHTFAAADAELGIYHVDYELLDASGVTVQPPAESDDGRIVVARPPPSPYRPRDLGLSIVMPAGEEFVVGGEAQFRYRLVNRAAVERHIRLYWDINHSLGVLADELTLAPNATFERDLSVPTPFLVGGGRFWLHVFEEEGEPHPRLPLVHVPNEGAAYQLSDSKGFRALSAATGVTVTLDRAQYAPGDVMTATLALQNLTTLPWSGALRVLGPGGVVVAELPVSFEANGTTTVPVDVTLPVARPVSGSGPTYTAEVVRAGRVVGATTWSVTVAAPELRSAALDVPAWSRVSSNQVTWTLTNPGLASAAGEARASLVGVSGAVLWSGTQAFQVSAQGQAALAWTLPALTEAAAGEAVLRLVADDGSGRPLVATREVRSRLLASVAHLSGVGAGDAVTLRVALANEGTYQEEGDLDAQVEGVGAAGPVAYGLAPGQKVETLLPLTIPADVRGGLHRGRVRLSSQARPVEFTLGVHPPRLMLALAEQSYAAGDVLVFTLGNDGGAASLALVDLRLRRLDGGSVVSRTESISVAREGEITLGLALAAQFPSGTYRLEALADDTRHGVQARLQREMTIAGTGATVEIETDREAYAAGAPMTVTTRVTNSGVALEDATWRVEVVRACGEPVGNGGDFSGLAGAPLALNEAGGCGVVWEIETVADLAPAQEREQVDTPEAPAEIGAYVARVELVTTDGHVLARAERAFSVTTTDVALRVVTERTLYSTTETVAISGVVRNDGAGAETGLRLRVELQADDRAALVFDEGVTLAPGEARVFDASVIPATRALFGDLRVVAELTHDDATVARAVTTLRTGDPALSAVLRAPGPGLRVAPTSARFVALAADDLDARLTAGETWLDGTLPFAVTLPGDFEDVSYDRFRLFAGGHVELVAVGAEPSSSPAACLSEFSDDAALLAPALLDFDAGAGSAGFKLFVTGSRDDEGREFADDTLVFVWDAPLTSEPGGPRRRAQALIARDGLLRLDADALPAGPPACARRGVRVPFTRAQVIESDGARVERGVGRGGFEVEAVVANVGTYPATVTVDVGRVDGARQVETLTLDPAESRVFRQSDTQPGAYSLLLAGDAQVELTREVVAGEGLRIEYAGEDTLRAGAASMPVRVVKRGGVGGPVAVTYRLTGAGPEQTRTRTYDLEPGMWADDALDFELSEGAPLRLTVDVEDVAFEGFDVELRAGPQERVELTATAGLPSAGVLPVALDLANTGLDDVSGELLLEGPGGARADVTLAAGESRHVDVSVPLEGIVPGPQAYVARFVTSAGVTLATAMLDVTIQPAQVDLVATPEGQTYDAGTVAPFAFTLRNAGDQAARGTLRFEIFDRQVEAPVALGPAAEVEVTFPLSIEDDVETKRVAGRYVLTIDGGEPVAGQVNVTLRGATLALDATLDREAYADGETAHVMLHVTNGHPTAGSEYVARVRYGAFDEQRPFSVADEATLTFDVPLPRVTGELLFIGITHPDGRSLVIDTRHVRRADALLVLTLDRQVYEPGATLLLTAAPAEPGTLTLDLPGHAETIAASAPVTRAVTLPADLIGGTQHVTWTFAAASGASAAGETPFDVAGLRVRVLAADLDRGRYASGDTLTSTLRVTTNEAATVTLRAFAIDPDESSELIGEAALTLDPDEDLLATHAWPFATTVAGLHRFVYGLYRGEALLASGSIAFDVGAAAVLGVRTSQAEYAAPDAEVEAVVTAFVGAPAELRLEVDGATALTREVTTTGLVTLPLTLPGVAPGAHRLDALLEAGGLTSRRTAFFALGTSLPDLVASPASARQVQGAEWSLDLDVSNVGRGVAGATTVLVRAAVSGTQLASAAVPALDANATARVVVPWDVSGLAGERAIEAVVDAGEAVGEFREDNNVTPSSVSVPALAADIEAAASVPANVAASLGVTLTNLSADTTQAGLTSALALTRPDGSALTLATWPVPELAPGASTTRTTPWSVGRAAPGVYVLDAQVHDPQAVTRASAVHALEVRPTVAFGGHVGATPSPAQSGEPVVFSGEVVNAGNVALDGEAWFELLAADGTLARRATTPVSVPLDGAVAVEATTPLLDVAPGDYALDLRVASEGHEHPVASSSLRVEGETVRVTLDRDASPRVLAFIGGAVNDAAGRARRNAFVDAALPPGGSLVARTSDALDFVRRLRSGAWNTHVAFTEHALLLLPLLSDELREAVVRGDGLLLAQWGAGATPALDEALGARVTGVRPGTTHALTLQASPLGPARSLIVSSEASRLTLDGATAVGTFGAQPAVTLHALGAGDAAVFAFDPAVTTTDPARATLEELFAAATAYVAPGQPRDARAGTVMPLAFALDNPTSSERRVEASVTLPAGVSAVSADDGAITVDPPTWDVTLGPGATRRLRLAVGLPDATGDVVIASSVRVDGVLQGAPPSVTLTVPATTAAMLVNVIAALQALPVGPGEHGPRASALVALRAVQAAPTTPVGLELRIRLAAEAAERIGRLTHESAPTLRSEVASLIAAWERASVTP